MAKIWLELLLALTVASNVLAYYRCPQPNGLFADPSSCSKFYHCSNNEPFLKDCAAGTHWNARSGICDWPSNARCGHYADIGRFRTHHIVSPQYYNYIAPTVVPSAKLLEQFKCPVRYGFALHESDCSSYYACSNWQPIEKQCPNGMHWSRYLARCDWPDRAGCRGSRRLKLSEVVDRRSNGGRSLPRSDIPFVPLNDLKRLSALKKSDRDREQFRDIQIFPRQRFKLERGDDLLTGFGAKLANEKEWHRSPLVRKGLLAEPFGREAERSLYPQSRDYFARYNIEPR